MIAAGQLNRRITFLRPTHATDSLGEVRPTHKIVATEWAKVTAEAVDETTQNGTTVAATRYTIVIRQRKSLTPQADWLIDYDEKRLTISSIADLQQKREEWTIVAHSQRQAQTSQCQ